VVEEDVRTVTDVLIALAGGVVGIVGGYVFGVLRTLSEHRNERRDAALAEIYKEMSLFHHYLFSWTDDVDPDPDKPTAASVDIPARDHVNEQYQKFTHTFHDVNAIWLGKDTYDLIQGFSVASRDFLNELESMRKRAGAWCLPDGTNSKDRREERRITPKFYEVRDALREEVESSRDLYSWLRYHIAKRKKRREKIRSGKQPSWGRKLSRKDVMCLAAVTQVYVAMPASLATILQDHARNVLIHDSYASRRTLIAA
jgi:hypothetical protein